MPLTSTIDFRNKVAVGLAALAVSTHQDVLLMAASLGSCLGIAAHDPHVPVTGLLHVMLPDSAVSPAKAALYPALFVDTGLTALLDAMQRVRVKVSGQDRDIILCKNWTIT